MASGSLPTVVAITAANFIDTIGINTHFDFNAYGYQNLSATEAAINYLGIKNLRDSGGNSSDLSTWQQVSAATGAKFDDYMPEGAPAWLQSSLSLVPQLAAEGILNYVEGGNEDDDPYAIANGNSLGWTAQFQQQVYSVGHSLGLPVINMSFGAGWTAANNWQGDYGAVGDLSAYTDYANAHTYANPGQTPDSAMQFINGLSKLAASSRPTITTEIGWDENQGFSQAQIAQFVVDAVLDGIKDGDVKTYFYALYDDGAGRFGLMNQDGTPKPAGTAIHDLTTLLADSGGSFTPGSLSYGLSGGQGGENTLLLQKSDGSDWIAVWDETDGAHSVTLNLASAASQIVVYDPVTGTSAMQTLSNASSVTLNLNGDPLLVKVGGAGGSTSGGTTTGSGGSTSGGSTSGGTVLSPSDLTVTVPASQTVAANGTDAISGVSVTDPWAAACPGAMALNLWDGSGAPLLVNGAKVSGTINGTLSQLNADLASLKYQAGATGSDTVTVDVWNQAGVEVTKTINLTIGGSTSGGSTSGGTTSGGTTSGGTTSTITIAATDANPIVSNSNTTISATSGDHMIFIGGSFDTLTAIGGTETVLAFQGNNTISTGSGNDSIQIAGSGNTVNAGTGNNQISDAGSGNTIVLGPGGTSNDTISGYVLQNGDTLDLRPALASTKWTGSSSTVGSFLQERTSGADTIISVTPSGVAGSTSYDVATLKGTGGVTMSTLLAHSIT